MNRREMLQLLGAAAVVPRWKPWGARMARLDRIGVQLYTVRDAMAHDVPGTLAKVAAIGYQEVEFAGYFNQTPKRIRAALDADGLVAPSAHLALEDVRDHWDTTLEAARTIGHHYLVVPWIDEDMRTADGYKRIAETFNHIGEKANAAGLHFAYHNHNFEFKTVPGSGGKRGYDILLDNTDPHLVGFEMDLYWIIDGGGDPSDYFAKYPGRFPMVHLKDMDTAGHMTSVGSGVIPWAQILGEREEAGIRHYFVEHDQPKQPFESIRKSYQYLRNLRF